MGIFGKIPWPRLTMYLSLPNLSIIPCTIFLISLGGDNKRQGSKFPCSVLFPPERYLAFFAEQVQSIPMAEALELAISGKANQQPFPKTITGA